MSWAEFRIRSIAFKRMREDKMKMVREVSYEVFKLNYLMSKKKPPSKNKFWPIGEDAKRQNEVSEEVKNIILQQQREYKAKKGD